MWRKKMLIEKITNVTFSNGILRLETAIVNPRGELQSNGSLEIPGSQVSNVINSISQAAQSISDKLSANENSVDKSDSNGEQPKKSSKEKNKKK